MSFSALFYVITAAAYLILSLWHLRLIRLEKRISTLPENDRLQIVKSELGAKSAKGVTAKQYIEQRQHFIRIVMQPLVSVVILAAALYIIMSDHISPQDKHWAYGAVGTVIGFWLKG